MTTLWLDHGADALRLAVPTRAVCGGGRLMPAASLEHEEPRSSVGRNTPSK